MVSSVNFTTLDLPSSEQFQAWREFNATIAEIFLVRDDRAAFPVSHRSWNIRNLILTQAHLPGDIERRWRHLPKSYFDHWCVVLARAGGGRHSSLSCRSLARAFEGRGVDETVTTLFLPRETVGGGSRKLETDEARGETGGLRLILSDYLENLGRRLPSLAEADMPKLEETTIAMVMACVAPSPARFAEAERPMSALLVERARRAVRQNVGRHSLNPDELCKLIAVSRSRLYRLLDSYGGVAHFIQEERLEEARRRLLDPRSTLPINILANEVGFVDHSTFSRAFKRKFLQSPSEMRERAITEAYAPPALSTDPQGM
jgi:AraC-like DNA-binding protein